MPYENPSDAMNRREHGDRASGSRSVIRQALGIGLLAALAVVALAEGAGSSASAVAASVPQLDLRAYLKLKPRDLPQRYRDWLEQEVVWIITGRERDLFLRLDSDEKRDRFIDAFWEHRDPTPGTPKNEYIAIHYQRLAYANHEFGRVSPGPGWRTDMGRIYVLLGAPQSRQRFDNDASVYPVEVWFYQADPRLGVPVFFYVVFFRQQGMGEYKLYSPAADGPEQLLNPSGRDRVRRQGGLGGRGLGQGGLIEGGQGTYDLLRLISPDLADAAFSLIPGEAWLGSPLRSDSLIGDILEIPEVAVPSVDWAYPILVGASETEVRFKTLSIDTRAIGWLDPAGQPFVTYVARAPGPALNLGEHDGEHYMTFSIQTYLLDSSQTVLEGASPRLMQSGLSETQVPRLRSGALLYIDRIPAVPGALELDVVLENNVSHEYGEASATTIVPVPHPTEVTLGQPILCAGARALGEAYDPFMPQLPFQIGALAMTPTLDGPFAVGGQLLVFHQVFLPAGHTTPVSVVYELSNAGGRLVSRKQIAVQPDEADSRGVVNQLTGIGVDVPPGDYSLSIGLAGDEPLTRLPVRVRADVDRPVVHAAATPPPTDPGLLVRRAAILRAAGKIEAAIPLVDDALSRDPDLDEGLQLQLELLRDGGHYERLEQLLQERLAATPHDLDLLLQMAEATALQGKHYDAIRFYERAVLERSNRPAVLNALAAEYLAEGAEAGAANIERAIELLTRSLQLDASQTGVRTTLARAREAQGGAR